MRSIECQHCGHPFDVEDDLIGGFTNCPHCQKATAVEGLRDPLWRLGQLGAVVVLALIASPFFFAYGMLTAINVFLGGLAIVWLISRAF